MADNIARLKKQREMTQVTLNLKKFQAEQDALFQQAEKFNKEQVEFPYIQVTVPDAKTPTAAADPLSEKERNGSPTCTKDPVLDEAIQVLNDWQSLLPPR